MHPTQWTAVECITNIGLYILPSSFNTQRTAVDIGLATEDYALVVGMPGTGKTSTIAVLANVLLHRGLSVLVVSYTHLAVDNLLLKILEVGQDAASGER
jgi:DNA replication ATP-dependent helicase Dna2